MATSLKKINFQCITDHHTPMILSNPCFHCMELKVSYLCICNVKFTDLSWRTFLLDLDLVSTAVRIEVYILIAGYKVVEIFDFLLAHHAPLSSHVDKCSCELHNYPELKHCGLEDTDSFEGAVIQFLQYFQFNISMNMTCYSLFLQSQSQKTRHHPQSHVQHVSQQNHWHWLRQEDCNANPEQNLHW